MSRTLTHRIAEWASSQTLIHEISQHIGIDSMEHGWEPENQFSRSFGLDYAAAWATYSAHLGSLGYATDFPFLNRLANSSSFHIPALTDLWTDGQAKMLNLSRLHRMFVESSIPELRDIGAKTELFSPSRLYESRLVKYHTQFNRDNLSIILRLIEELRSAIHYYAAMHGFDVCMRPALNLSLKSYTTIVNAGSPTFIAPELHYPAGFSAALNHPLMGNKLMTDWSRHFDVLLSSRPENNFEQPHELEQFKFTKWDGINAYSMAWNVESMIAVAAHPKVIRPNFVFHRNSGLVTQSIEENVDYNWFALDQYSIHDAIPVSYDIENLPDVPNRKAAIEAARTIGLGMLVYNQLLTQAFSTIPTGKGTSKPKWSVTPANLPASIINLNIAMNIGHFVDL